MTDRGHAGDEWRTTTLGEIVTLQRGFDLPITERKPGPYPVVASAGPVGTHHRPMVKGPGVVLGRSGSLGGGQFIEHDFWPLNTTLWVRDFKTNDPRFCYFLLKSLDLKQLNAGSGVPTLNRNHVHPLPVRVPPIPEQRVIAHILGTLDDKIELNRRMNATLDAMARALFRSWFVDFDPVRAKTEGLDTGLPKDIADLFPDQLVDSELGQIPNGWEVGCVKDLCERVENGGTPKRAEPRYWNGEIYWFKTAELHDEPLLVSEERISDDGLRESSCKIWPSGTVLIALYASPTVGRLGILEVPAAANQACSALVASGDYGSQFMFYSLLFSRGHFQNIAVGAAQQNINQEVVRQHRIVVPFSRLARAFESTVYDLHRRRIECLRESRGLAALRDALLLKLFSGELRLGETGGTPNPDGAAELE